MGRNEDPDSIAMKCMGIFFGGVVFVLVLLWLFQETKP